jgi:Ni,Fe-hydrogenase maturation factor
VTALPAAGVLLIGLGNPLRGDDCVGWHLVGERGLCLHQLTPELIPDLATAERVLFVDAWMAPPGAEPLLRAVAATTAWQGETHRLDPSALLGLARVLGVGPMAAHELLVPAFDFSWTAPDPHHGRDSAAAGFSPSLQRQLPRARQLLRQWLQGRAVEPCHA